ncbi:MAG: hypothetical protein IKD53_05195 [Clostridia bacterium]|nr:hypothetical protein [Clostridia bacterium]
MRIWVKATYRATMTLFRNYSRFSAAEKAEARARADAIDQHNTAIAERIYNDIIEGRTLYAHQLYNKGFTRQVIHQSSRGNYLQITHLCKIGGEWTPTSHQDAYSARDVDRALKHGQYINIVAV